MISSTFAGICSTFAANIPFFGTLIGQVCNIFVSALQTFGL